MKNASSSKKKTTDNTILQNTAENRVSLFKENFAKESSFIRGRIVQDLPSYNVLLNLKATTFEELALQVIAKQRGMSYDKEHPPMPECPHCGSIDTQPKFVWDKRITNVYICNDCKNSLTANHNSITSKAKKDLLTWVKFIYCLLNYEPVAKTTKYCGIAPNTYYQMRNHICYAIHIFLSKLRLYGHIQADETYVRMSYKGTNLNSSEFDEDDYRFDDSPKPREKRERGGSYSFRERNRNHICVFAAADDHGHSFTCYAGVGVPGFRKLKQHVPIEKFLSAVPDSDPFAYTRKRRAEPKTKPGDLSIFITDREQAIMKYGADLLPMECYSRVFRRNNKQTRVSKQHQDYNIQRVNYIHRRLDEHLRKSGSGSSKYIRGSLLLFDFMMNTGAPDNQAAIDELLRILVTPNLRQDDSVYEALVAAPDYYYEWQDQDNYLQKLSPMLLAAYYLRDKQKHPEEYPGAAIPTDEEIEEMTGLTMATIRSHYKKLTEQGQRAKIVAMYYTSGADSATGQTKSTQPKPTRRSVTNEILLAYDEYAKMLAGPDHAKTSFEAMFPALKEKYHLPYALSTMLNKFHEIEELGLRAPLPNRSARSRINNGYRVAGTAFEVLDAFNEILEDFNKSGTPVPKQSVITRMLKERFPNYSIKSLEVYLWRARDYVKAHGHPEGKTVCALDVFELKEEAICHIFDEFAEYKKTHHYDADAETAYLQELMTKHNIQMTQKALFARFYKLIARGIRRPLPPYKKKQKTPKENIPPLAFTMYDAFQRIAQAYAEKGLPMPSNTVIYNTIKNDLQLELKDSSMRAYMAKVRAFLESQKEKPKNPR